MYLGIDPGKSGGLVWIDEEGNVVRWHVMPPTAWDLLETLNKEQVTACCLEKVQSMPGEGHKGAFTFGFGFGLLVMGVTAIQAPYELVHPKTWQKEFSIVGRKRGEPKHLLKERCHTTAKTLFPKFSLWKKPRTKGKQMAVCDALLLAEYCRRVHLGLRRKN